jgi:hypothetical protein
LNEANTQPNYFVLKKNREIKDSAPKDEKTHTRHVDLCAVSGINGDVLMDARTDSSKGSLVSLYAFPRLVVIGFEKRHVGGNDEMVADRFLPEEIGYKGRPGEDSDRFHLRSLNDVALAVEMTDKSLTCFDAM